MRNENAGSSERICGFECGVHKGAVCCVTYSDTERARRSSPPFPGLVATFSDAGSPHQHTHFYVLNDGTLLTHSWGLPGLPEEWTAERPDSRAATSAVPRRVRESVRQVMREDSRLGFITVGPWFPETLRPEEWERLRREIGVRSTDVVKDYLGKFGSKRESRKRGRPRPSRRK